MLITLTLILIFYTLVMGCLIYGFDKQSAFILNNEIQKTSFSVIVPFRNESKTLQGLLESLYNMDYPKALYEVILVNDDSQDHSLHIIESFKLKNPKLTIRCIDNINTSASPKKDAITLAINYAKYNWIVTTDADCIIPKYWLQCYDQCIVTTKSEFICAPVMIDDDSTFLTRFQALDFLSLQAATIGAFGLQKPILCNGANMAYTKDLFNRLDGYKGNLHIASGDDIFLLEKILHEDTSKALYIKSCHVVVKTKPEQAVNTLCSQKIRWIKKTTQYKNIYSKIISISVFMTNVSLLVFLCLTIFNFLPLKYFLYVIIVKVSIDFLLLFKASRFFNTEHLLGSYVLSAIIYPFYSTYIVIRSMTRHYTWKDRTHSI